MKHRLLRNNLNWIDCSISLLDKRIANMSTGLMLDLNSFRFDILFQETDDPFNAMVANLT